jgi:hypothetical protein
MSSPPTTSPSLPFRLLNLTLQTLLLAAALYLIPTSIHHIVLSLDTIHELLGRRARSPYAPDIPWTSVLIAWHVWLGRMSYKASGKGAGAWGKVLGRIVVPGAVIMFGVLFGWKVVRAGMGVGIFG